MNKRQDFNSFFGDGGVLGDAAFRSSSPPTNPKMTGAGFPGFIRLNPPEGRYLWMVASLAKHGIMEVGRYFGGSTTLLGLAKSPKVPLVSIDIAPQMDAPLSSLLSHLSVTKTWLLVGDSRAANIVPSDFSYDVLFIDGDHSYEGVLGDVENLVPRIRRGGHIVFHDCYDGSEVLSAVSDLISSDSYAFHVARSPFNIKTGRESNTLCHLIKR